MTFGSSTSISVRPLKPALSRVYLNVVWVWVYLVNVTFHLLHDRIKLVADTWNTECSLRCVFPLCMVMCAQVCVCLHPEFIYPTGVFQTLQAFDHLPLDMDLLLWLPDDKMYSAPPKEKWNQVETVKTRREWNSLTESYLWNIGPRRKNKLMEIQVSELVFIVGTMFWCQCSIWPQP